MPIYTDLDVVNAACALLAVEPLQALDAETPGGQTVQALYDPVVELCLGMTPWSFARRIRQLAQVSGVTSTLGFSYIHALPAEMLGMPARLLADPTGMGGAIQQYDYDEERRVHSHAEILYAHYTARVVPALWHPVFRTAVIHAVAAALAEPLTGNSALAQDKKSDAFGTPSEGYRGGLMRAALAADAFATPARTLPAASNPLLNEWMAG
jgi:hypothetical protein